MKPRLAAHLLIICPLMLLASACASTPPGNTAVNTAMAAWKGRWAAEAVASWGMPDSVSRDGMLGVLVWNADDAAARAAVPSGGGQPWPALCTRVLSVDAAEIIRHARWYGTDCSTDPADYAPR